MDHAESHATLDRFPHELPSKLPATSSLENGVLPLVREDVHKVHTACVGYIYRRDPSKEQGGDERRNERYSDRVLVQDGVRTSYLVRNS